MCQPDWKPGLLGSVFFLFWSASLLFVPKLADKFGRRWIYLSSRLIETALYIASVAISEYWGMVGLMSVFGLAAAGRINVQAVYIQEWVPRKSQTHWSVMFSVDSAFSELLALSLLWFVTQDTFYVRIIGLSLCLLSIPATIALPESPRLLAAQGNVTELQAAFQRMAWFNRKNFALTPD